MFCSDIMCHVDVSQIAQICGFNEWWNGKDNSALVGIPVLPPPPKHPHALVLVSSIDPSAFFSTFDPNKLEKIH